jgi:hypothetical protein
MTKGINNKGVRSGGAKVLNAMKVQNYQIAPVGQQKIQMLDQLDID